MLEALRRHDEGAANLRSWYPPSSGVLARIEQLHSQYPAGRRGARDDAAKPRHPHRHLHPPLNPGKYPSGFETLEKTPRPNYRTPSFWSNLTDCDTRDMANFATLEVRRENKARWRRIRGAIKMHMLGK